MRAIAWAAVFCGAMIARSAAAFDPPAPIRVTGFNADVVAENQNPRVVQEFDATGIAWAESGAKSGATNNGSATVSGFPAETPGQTVDFLSGKTNTVTGGNSTFRFQPYGTASGGASNNVLLLAASQHGTLTFSQPAAYNTLAIASVGTFPAASENSGFIIHFSNGSVSSSIGYNIAGYLNGASPAVFASPINVFSGAPASASSNPTLSINATNGQVRETDIDLNKTFVNGNINANTLAISSIEFIARADVVATGIFAVSGSPVPEPATLSIALFGAGYFSVRRRSNLRAP